MRTAVCFILLSCLLAVSFGQAVPPVVYKKTGFCAKGLVKKYRQQNVQFDRCRRVFSLPTGGKLVLQIFVKKLTQQKKLRILFRAKTSGYIAIGPNQNRMLNPNTTPFHRAMVAYRRTVNNKPRVAFRQFLLKGKAQPQVSPQGGIKVGALTGPWVTAMYDFQLRRRNPQKNIDVIFAISNEVVKNNKDIPYHDMAGAFKLPTGF